jgi:hypothetical protein
MPKKPIFSRKHYESIASILSELKYEVDSCSSVFEYTTALKSKLESLFKSDDPNFNINIWKKRIED